MVHFKFELNYQLKISCGLLYGCFHKNVYGSYSQSKETDLMKSCGNRNYRPWNSQIDVKQVSSTLHFRPSTEQNRFSTVRYVKNRKPEFNDGFQLHKLVRIKFQY